MTFAPAFAKAMDSGRPRVPAPPVMRMVRLRNEPAAAKCTFSVADIVRSAALIVVLISWYPLMHSKDNAKMPLDMGKGKYLYTRT